MAAVYTLSVYNIAIIKHFADKETEKVFNQVFSKKLPQSIQYVALRKLILIDNAASLDDLKVPPGNRLEALTGDREGQYSIRINDQYRICFIWNGSDFKDVEIVDYH
ncbi:type II toxin-antitoxin system RelE/ParE family toxin [Butyrivibrio sp. AE2032]|uniref:type II toxin-antitoxin system RelE/ParE family toxin n=1 Tax=Butyrivibrio sp. AE2032 TaxID=1458463 RepID=UPI001FA702B0|nr:type II toxin-antitoxin system RelE/ParE family toxin [Butyrivibrio sp. AE2032]